MMFNNIDDIIRRALNRTYADAPKTAMGCFSNEKLADYVEAIVNGEPAEEDVVRHITQCSLCFSKIASAVSALTTFGYKVRHGTLSQSHIQKAKVIPKAYPRAKKGGIKRNRFLFVSAGFFILSFIFPRYFIQFLVAAAIFGFKWVMDTGGSKALIMIYDAWQHKRFSETEERNRHPLIKDRRDI